MNANNEDITSRNENEHRAIVNAVLEKALWIHQQQREGDGTQDSSSSACKPDDPPKIHLPGNQGQSTASSAAVVSTNTSECSSASRTASRTSSSSPSEPRSVDEESEESSNGKTSASRTATRSPSTPSEPSVDGESEESSNGKTSPSRPASTSVSTPSERSVDGESEESSNAGKTSSNATAPPLSNRMIALQSQWEERFQRLLAYKKEFGDCLVPNRYSRDRQLGAWVSTQRRNFKAKAFGMTQERISRLEAIGFAWCTREPRSTTWADRYEELRQFHEIYGHSVVPINFTENKALSNWVSSQRQEYKSYIQNKPSRLTPEQIKLLSDIDFVWDALRHRKQPPVPAELLRPTSSTNRPQHEASLGPKVGSQGATEVLPPPQQISTDVLPVIQVLKETLEAAPTASIVVVAGQSHPRQGPRSRDSRPPKKRHKHKRKKRKRRDRGDAMTSGVVLSQTPTPSETTPLPIVSRNACFIAVPGAARNPNVLPPHAAARAIPTGIPQTISFHHGPHSPAVPTAAPMVQPLPQSNYSIQPFYTTYMAAQPGVFHQPAMPPGAICVYPVQGGYCFQPPPPQLPQQLPAPLPPAPTQPPGNNGVRRPT